MEPCTPVSPSGLGSGGGARRHPHPSVIAYVTAAERLHHVLRTRETRATPASLTLTIVRYTHTNGSPKNPVRGVNYSCRAADLIVAAHPGRFNIAIRLNMPIDWDAVDLRITNLPDANRYVGPEYRDGWTLERE
jgi:hypothetical protein